MCRHVQGFVVAQDGEVGQQDGDPEDLRRDQRHDAQCGPAFTFTLCRSACDSDSRCPACLHLDGSGSSSLRGCCCAVNCFRVMMTTQRRGRSLYSRVHKDGRGLGTYVRGSHLVKVPLWFLILTLKFALTILTYIFRILSTS